MNQEMRNLLAKASVVGEAPAQSFESEPTSHSKSTGGPPRAEGNSLYDWMLERFHSAIGELEAQRAVVLARHALEVAQRNPGPAEGLREVGSLPWKREIAREAEKAKGSDNIGRIATRHSVSRATVYRYRSMYGERDAA